MTSVTQRPSADDREEPPPGRTDELSSEERSALWTTRRRIGVAEAAARHPLITILPVVICVAAALFVGISRDPTYTAKTRMRVSSLNLGAPGALSGLFTASQSLAATYALSVDADGVVGPAAERLGMAPGRVRRDVSATPVAQSAVFTVTAKADDSLRARMVANAVSESLTRFVATQTTRRPESALLREFRDKSATLNHARLVATRAQQAYEDVPSGANARRLENARTDVATAAVEAETAQTAFRNARINTAPQPRVQLLRRAATATSDRSTVLQVLAFAGLVAGVLIGLALATFTANRKLRRQLGL